MLSTIEDAVAAVAAGKFALVVDDLDRENEGDFIGAASTATKESVALMLRHTTGVVCAPLPQSRATSLSLPLMVPENNEDPYRTAFTVTVDYRHGTSTGISPADRAATIRALADTERARASDFTRPGHVFPLLYRDGGVMVRGGHTEASVDLTRLAGLGEVAYLCEIYNHETGEMSRLPELIDLAGKLSLPLVTIADLQRYRYQREVLVVAARGGGGVESDGVKDVVRSAAEKALRAVAAGARRNEQQEEEEGEGDESPTPSAAAAASSSSLSGSAASSSSANGSSFDPIVGGSSPSSASSTSSLASLAGSGAPSAARDGGGASPSLLPSTTSSSSSSSSSSASAPSAPAVGSASPRSLEFESIYFKGQSYSCTVRPRAAGAVASAAPPSVRVTFAAVDGGKEGAGDESGADISVCVSGLPWANVRGKSSSHLETVGTDASVKGEGTEDGLVPSSAPQPTAYDDLFPAPKGADLVAARAGFALHSVSDRTCAELGQVLRACVAAWQGKGGSVVLPAIAEGCYSTTKPLTRAEAEAIAESWPVISLEVQKGQPVPRVWMFGVRVKEGLVG